MKIALKTSSPDQTSIDPSLEHKRKRLAHEIEKPPLNPHGAKKPKHIHLDSASCYKISIIVTIRDCIDNFIDFVIKQGKNINNSIVSCGNGGSSSSVDSDSGGRACNSVVLKLSSSSPSSEVNDIPRHQEGEGENGSEFTSKLSVSKQQSPSLSSSSSSSLLLTATTPPNNNNNKNTKIVK